MSNKLLIHQLFEEVVNKADLGLADQIIAVDFVMHNPRPGQGKGLLGFKEGFRTSSGVSGLVQQY